MPSPHGFTYLHCYTKYPFDDQCLSCSDIFLRQVQLLQHGLLPQLQLVLFSVGLFYWCLKTRISGCYVKYANGAVSHLQIRKQVEKKRSHSGFQDSKEALWQLSSASSMCTSRTIRKKVSMTRNNIFISVTTNQMFEGFFLKQTNMKSMCCKCSHQTRWHGTTFKACKVSKIHSYATCVIA